MTEPSLTPREQRIVASLASGKTLKEIANDMDMDQRYASVLLARMRKRLGYQTVRQMMWELGRAQ